LTLRVTGGTTPYSFYWANGQRSQTLTGIGSGNYQVFVVDYYGDYTASTVCSLIAPSATPTQTTTATPTPTPTRPCTKLCMIIVTQNQSYGPWEFNCNGTSNGRSLWNYNNQYYIKWDLDRRRWTLFGPDLTTWVTFDNGASILRSTSTAEIPDSGWSFVGGTLQGTVSVTRGSCPAYVPLQIQTSVQNTNCGNTNCIGSIAITASNGVPPYQFSINNGNTFQSLNIFNGLCPNTYSIIAKDSLNNQVTRNVTVVANAQNVTYTLYTSLNYTNQPGTGQQICYWFVEVNPPLPVGVNVQFDLIFSSQKTFNGPGSEQLAR